MTDQVPDELSYKGESFRVVEGRLLNDDQIGGTGPWVPLKIDLASHPLFSELIYYYLIIAAVLIVLSFFIKGSLKER